MRSGRGTTITLPALAPEETPLTGQPGYQRGDPIALEYTADPHTRLQPGDQGTVTSYDPKLGPFPTAACVTTPLRWSFVSRTCP
jgi:hypothetical protein